MKKVVIIGAIVLIAGLIVLKTRTGTLETSSEIEEGRPLSKEVVTDLHKEKMQRILPEAERMLMKFDESKNSDWLSKAIAVTQLQEAGTPEEAIANRMALLRRLSSYYDASYDVKPPPLPQFNVMPPLGYEGVKPEEIEDVQLREDYKNRIEENIINSREHKLQTAVRQSMSSTVHLLLTKDNVSIADVEQYLLGQELPQEMFEAMMSMAREAMAK